MFSYLDLVLALGFAWMITGIVNLFIARTDESASPLMGAFPLAVFGLVLADNFLKPGMLTPRLLRIIYVPSRNAYFLIGPALWSYAQSLIRPRPRGKGLFPIHLIPFFLWSLFLFLKPGLALPGRVPSPHPRAWSVGFIRDVSSLLHQLAYCLGTLYLLLRNGRDTRHYYSSLGIRNTLSWMTVIVMAYVPVLLADGFCIFLMPEGARVTAAILTRILPSLLFIFFFSLFARDQKIPENRRDNPREGEGRGKYGTSPLTGADAERIFARLRAYLEREKPYLNPDLTLSSLAEDLGETRHRLSEAINRVSGTSFYGLINKYRLGEFERTLREGRFADYTITGRAFECGFRSPSAFYALFKKEKGVTPREFLRDLSP